MQKTTQVRETLNVMDSGPPNCHFATKTNKGIFVSKGLGLILLLIYLLSIVATILIVYKFAACPAAEKFPDVLKYQTFRNDCTTEAGQTASKTNLIESMETSTLNVGKSTYPSTTFRVVEDKNVYRSGPSTAVENVRLPRSMHPEKYYIKLTPYIFEGNFTFDGEVDMLLNVTESTANVTLHAVELSIHETNLFKYINGEKRENIRIVSATEDPIRQFYILHLNTQLLAGERYWLHVKYVGKLNDYLDGFYRSSYVENNKTRWIAVTQFQPTDARKAFPCMDEPALKARFTVSLARRAHMSSLSNMNRAREPEPHAYLKDYVWDHYEESLPMSTYLVAFAITDFEKLSVGNFSVWARREAISSAKYALEVGPKILNFFQDFYQIKFPLPKLDMIAIPDFNAGAMENWGLLTFRETTMLYSAGVSARAAQARVATVVAHELAHQWFGNLVTPRWWSDIWLNEGFASYVEYIAIDVVEKSWRSMEHFVINEIQNVFTLDALETSHQISVEVGNPNQINEIFDKISYGKGSAIIRMMNHFLTDEVFNRGITGYLQSKMYGSAEQDDLWAALTSEARRDGGLFAEGVSVKRIMDTWTLQTGFPVVTVVRDYEGGEVKFVQERFVLLNNTESKPPKPLWWIPISYTTRALGAFNDTRAALWLAGREEARHAIDVASGDWLIVNIQQTGFYRVNYDIANWKLIIAQLNDPSGFERIHPINRAQLVDDAMNLALNGRLAYTTALDLTKYLAHERSYVPWKSGLVAMGYIDAMLSKGPYYLEYKTHVLRLLEGVYRAVGFSQRPGDSMPTVFQRVDVLSAACHLQHADCVSKSVMLFHEWMISRNPDINFMEPDVRGAAYCGALGAGGAAEWQFAWRRFRAARVASERELLLTALGCTRHPHLLSRYLDFAMRNDTGIRKQDVFRVFAAVAGSVTGQPIAFAFVRTNWDRMKKYLGSESTNLDPIIKVVTKRLNQQHELDELKKFATKHQSEFGRTMSQAIERTRANIQWMERNAQTIVDWLLESKIPDAETSS